MESMKTKVAAMFSILVAGVFDFLNWIGVNIIESDFDIFLTRTGRIVAIAAGVASVINYLIKWRRRDKNGTF